MFVVTWDKDFPGRWHWPEPEIGVTVSISISTVQDGEWPRRHGTGAGHIYLSGVRTFPQLRLLYFSSDFGYNIDDYNDQKNQQLHTILIIIVSVFSACCIILMVYMLMFPATSSLPPPGGGLGQDTPDKAQQKTLVPPLLKRNSQILEDKV